MPSIPNDIYSKLTEINCEDVATRLGLTVRNHKCNCFMHEDRHPSLSFFNKGRTAWKCFACNTGGSAIQLVMQFFGSSTYDAGVWLGNEFGIWQQLNNTTTVRWEPKVYVNPAQDEMLSEKKIFDSEVAQFVLDSSTLTPEASSFLYDERKLDKEVVEKLGISAISDSIGMTNALLSKFDKDRLLDSGLVKETKYGYYLRMWTPCLLFPYKDINGNLIGIQSRYLGQNVNAPRFQFISSSKTHFFNLPELRYLKAYDTIYLSEGITDCLALLSSGKKAIGLPSATNIPTDDLPFLRGLNVIMAADNDKAGQKAIDDVLNSITDFINEFSILRLPEVYKDFSEFYMKQQGEDTEASKESYFPSSLTEFRFIQSFQNSIARRNRTQQNNERADSSSPKGNIRNEQYLMEIWTSLIKSEIEKRNLQKDKKEAIQKIMDTLSLIETHEQRKLKAFCHWLSFQEYGHYNMTYFNPSTDSFDSMISRAVDKISMITKIINLIDSLTWEKLNKENLNKKKPGIAIVFDGFFKVSRSQKGFLTIDSTTNNIQDLLSADSRKTLIRLWKENHESPCFEITGNDNYDKEGAKKINMKIDSALEMLKYGKIRYDDDEK